MATFERLFCFFSYYIKNGDSSSGVSALITCLGFFFLNSLSADTLSYVSTFYLQLFVMHF